MKRVRAALVFWATLSISLSALVAPGCGPDRLAYPSTGKTLAYTPGTPDFDLEIFEDADSTGSQLNLSFRIPHSSLVYVRNGQRFRAEYELRSRVIPDTDSLQYVDDLTVDSLFTRREGDRSGEELFTRRYRVDPGEYRVEATLEDRNTGGRTVREQRATVFSVLDGCARFSRLRLYRTSGGVRERYLPFHIRAGADTIEATAKVFNTANLGGHTVAATLIRYPSDSSVASPPFYFSPTTWALAYRGIAFEKPETLWTREMKVGRDSAELLRFSGMLLRRGLYQLGLSGTSMPCGGGSEPASVSRQSYLCILGPDFPRLLTIPDLIEPLVYIATPAVYEELRDTGDTENQRLLFERFWLRAGRSEVSARNLMKQYYTRVEEANLRFSAYKEGWKTDRGMIYVVFGPPGYIDYEFRKEIWVYDIGIRFIFQRVTPFKPDEPFENYLLSRSTAYEYYWDRAVARWRSGDVF